MSKKFKKIKGKPLDPREYGVDISDPEEVRAWRKFLKVELIKSRSWVCECGCEESCTRGRDLHEGMVTKAHTRGLDWQPMIFSEVNCFLVRHDHHILRPMKQSWFAARAIRRYGKKVVEEWLKSLPWKGVREFCQD